MSEDLAVVLVMGSALIAFAILIVVAILKQFLFVGRPDELLIFSGRTRALPDGTTVGYREVIGGGRAVRWPVLERVDRMSLMAIPIDIQVQNAYSRGGIPLRVHAVANVKVSSDPMIVKNAIERFLGRDESELQRVAKETLEGHLRGVLARLTPEEVNEDRLKFAEALVDEAEEDFAKLGLALDTLKIQNVSDDVKYLDSIGRKRIAEVVRDAEIAESTAMNEAKVVEAKAGREGEVAAQSAQTVVVQRQNQLRQLKAQLEAEAATEEQRAELAATQARAESEAELQEVRKQLEGLRLTADVILPAQAEQQAQALRARAAAAPIEENGRAMADVLRMMTETWVKAGPDARDIFLIQQLEQLLALVVNRVKTLHVGETTLLDTGSGDALPRHVASFPATVREVLQELSHTTGIDVSGILTGASRPLHSSNRVMAPESLEPPEPDTSPGLAPALLDVPTSLVSQRALGGES